MYLAHIYMYNLNKRNTTNKQIPKLAGRGRGGEGGGKTFFFLILNPRYLVFVLESVDAERRFAGKSQVESMQGKSLVLPYYLTLL